MGGWGRGTERKKGKEVACFTVYLWRGLHSHSLVTISTTDISSSGFVSFFKIEELALAYSFRGLESIMVGGCGMTAVAAEGS